MDSRLEESATREPQVKKTECPACTLPMQLRSPSLAQVLAGTQIAANVPQNLNDKPKTDQHR